MKTRVLLLSVLVFLVTTAASAAPNNNFPTGVPGYNVKRIVDVFSANEYAAAKEFEGKTVGVGGLITGVKKSPYFTDPAGFKGNRGMFPTVEIALFSAYLVGDPIDPSILNQGDRIVMVCEKLQKGLVGFQAECKVAMTGPPVDKYTMESTYINQELYEMLYGKE